MNILHVHGFRRNGGSDGFGLARACQILLEQGREVMRLTRDSRQLKATLGAGELSALYEAACRG